MIVVEMALVWMEGERLKDRYSIDGNLPWRSGDAGAIEAPAFWNRGWDRPAPAGMTVWK